MTCQELRGRMDAVRAGTLSPEEKAAAEAHLAACDGCREAMASPLPRLGARGLFSPLAATAVLAAVAFVLLRRGDAPRAPAGASGDGAAPAGGTPEPPGPTGNGPAVPPPLPAAPREPGPAAPAAPADGPLAPGEILQMTPQGPIRIRTSVVQSAPIGDVKPAPEPVTPKMPRAPDPAGPLAPKSGGTQVEPRAIRPPAGGGPEEERPEQPVGPGVPEGAAPPAVQPEAPRIPDPPKGRGDAPPGPPAPATGDARPGAIREPGTPARPADRPGEADRPGDVPSPEVPEGAAPPGASAAGVSASTEKSRKERAILTDPLRSTEHRREAARTLGQMKAADALPDLLAVLRDETAPSLRAAAADALAAIGLADARVVGGLREALESEPADSLALVPDLAEALRRLGQKDYLAERLRGDLYDLSPRVRARGALAAGRGEALRLGGRLLELLSDRTFVRAGEPRLLGRPVPGEAGARADLEVRHFAWRGLTLVSGGADFALDAEAWRRSLARRRSEVGKGGETPVEDLPPPAPREPLVFEGAEAVRAVFPKMDEVLGSRDPALLDAMIAALRGTLDFPKIRDARGDPVPALLRGLPAFPDSAARDRFLAALYAEVVRRRLHPPLAALEGLRDAGAGGRKALVGRLGKDGALGRLVNEWLIAAAADPEGPYREGPVLLALVDGLRGIEPPARPWTRRDGKDADARAADSLRFRDEAKSLAAWWNRERARLDWDVATATLKAR
ncbi:MAG: HEAT repeat domain-containing protein [Planctomycetales bacterium]|nr:HEAT repeat domain-containing protein [Planctomycetales bacterium]